MLSNADMYYMTRTDLTLPDLTGVPDFAAGLVYGLTGDNHLDEIRHCFDGSASMLKHAEDALDDIKHLKLIKGAKDIGKVIWTLPDSFSSCQNMDSDVAAIEEWADIFHHPIQLGELVTKRWLTHGEEIKHDIEM